MAEKIIIRQNDRYETKIFASDPQDPESGNLSSKEREKLFLISHHCPIHKMLAGGIKVQSQLANE